MTDEAYVFISDAREKKSIAVSAHHKVSRHRGCKLPYEAIPYTQRYKLNGEVKSMNIDKPMTWDEFKALPDDIKVKYIVRLRDLYHADYPHIARMLGVTDRYLNQVANGLGISSKGDDGKIIRNRMTWQQKESWKAFCNGVLGGSPKAEIKIEEPKIIAVDLDPALLNPALMVDPQQPVAVDSIPEPVPEPKMEPQPAPNSISVTVDNLSSWAYLFQMLNNIPIQAGAKVTVIISNGGGN